MGKAETNHLFGGVWVGQVKNIENIKQVGGGFLGFSGRFDK